MKIILIILPLLLSACAYKQSPENLTAASYNVELGLGYLAQDDRLRAREKLLRAAHQAPNLLKTHLALAYYYQTVGDIHAADHAYQHALKIDSKAGRTNNNYGAFLCAQGEYQDAMLYFLRAMEDPHYPQTVSAYENAALCSAKMADDKTAAYYADLALQQDPKRTDLLLKIKILQGKPSDLQTES